MPKKKDLSLVRRDMDIQARIARGERLTDIAQLYGLTVSRISQIHRSVRDLVADEEKREIIAAKLEYALDEKLLMLLNEPRKIKVTAQGRACYELDEYGKPDYTRPILDDAAIIEAAKAVTSVAHELATLYGLHRKQPRAADESADIAEWQIYVEQILAENRQLKQLAAGQGNEDEVIDGEVVGEEQGTPPGGE